MNREDYERTIDLLVGDGDYRRALYGHDAEQRAKIERLKAVTDTLKLHAQIHAQEARTANSTIAEIYQCVSGATGEAGNWHGAQPVRAEIERLNHELNQAHEACAALREGKLRPFRMMKTSIMLDGNQWCVLYGANLQDGVAGFGNSPDMASRAFDAAWYQEIQQKEQEAARVKENRHETKAE